MATAAATKNRSETPRRLPHTKAPTFVFRNNHEVDSYVALVIEGQIRENNAAGLPTVLGLATGSTPIGVYRELIRLHKEEGLDFSRVITFNLDEYWPMDPASLHSYNRWMRETLFDHVNIPEENIHIPSGNLNQEEIEQFCEDYELKIQRAGGIHVQLLGIGRSGHIAFNEPGSPRNTRTRLVALDPVTIRDAASGFYGEENVPLHGITMGVGTILDARKVILIALGEHKASVVRRAIEGNVSEQVPASFLQTHASVVVALDDAAASELTAVQTPWLVGPVKWTSLLEKRAVIWLCQHLQKPIQKLTTRDFIENHLHELVRERGQSDRIRQRVFNELMRTLDSTTSSDEPRRAICFSPHPDDDVISMGGTLINLVQAGHEVHIAYMTSGNIAVFDHDAIRHIDYVSEYAELFGLTTEAGAELEGRMREAIAGKHPGDPDSEEVLNVKALIRKTEATAGAQVAGVPSEQLHFLDLPFYRTGEVTKRPIGDQDVTIIADLLRRLNPGEIYVAGDLSDPHGTHRMCAQAIVKALEIVNAEGVQPVVWLYRGAWEEYEPYEIERAVPLSPEVVLQKKFAIFMHESQKDRALYPGSDEREFWVRAEHRTKNTARIYNELGLPEFFALEGFVEFRGQL